jgi:predicted SAM-dependent methyltransferase
MMIKNFFLKIKYKKPYKLHLGCGSIFFEEWLHVDYSNHPQAIRHDLRRGVPLPNQSCSFIYQEHLLEHFDVGSGLFLLKECHRVLANNAVMRIAMPSLVDVIKAYENDWRDQDWLKLPEYRSIETRAEMINICFRAWGHEYLYDQEELYRRLKQVGFNEMRAVLWGESVYPELCGRETRRDSKLIVEVTKGIQ